MMALPTLVVIGLSLSVVNVESNAVMQTITPVSVRGRVASPLAAVRFGFDAPGRLVSSVRACGRAL